MEYLVNFVVDNDPVESNKQLPMFVNFIMHTDDNGTDAQFENIVFSYSSCGGKEKPFNLDKGLSNMNQLRKLKEKFGDDVTFVYQGTRD